MNDWRWMIALAVLSAGCAGGELDEMDGGRTNPEGTIPQGGADAGADASGETVSDVRETIEGPDAGGDVDETDASQVPDEGRPHCLLNDVSVAHMGIEASAIGADGTLYVAVGGDAVRLLTRRPDADWSTEIVAEAGDAPSIVATDDGLAAAWVERFADQAASTASIRYVRKVADTWEVPVTVAEIPTAPAHDTMVDVAVDAQGAPWLAWMQETDVGQVLRVAHYDAGAWDVETIEHGFRYPRLDIEVTSGGVLVGMTSPTRLATVRRRGDEWGEVKILEPTEAQTFDDLVVRGDEPEFVVRFDPHPAWGMIDEQSDETMRCDGATNGHPLAATILDDGTVGTIRSIYESPGRYRLAATQGCDEVAIDGSLHRQPDIHEFLAGYGGSKVAALREGSYSAAGDVRLFVHVDESTGSLRAVSSTDGGTSWAVEEVLEFRNFGYSHAVATDGDRTLVASVELATESVWVSEKLDQGWHSSQLDLGDCIVTEVASGTVDVELGEERAMIAVAAKCPSSFLSVTPMVFVEEEGSWAPVGTIDYDAVGDLRLDIALAPGGLPGVIARDSYDEYLWEWDGERWNSSAISTNDSGGEAEPALRYDDTRRVTVLSAFDSLDVRVRGEQGRDLVGVDHPRGEVDYDLVLEPGGPIRLAHATVDDEVVTIRYVEIEQEADGSLAVMVDEFVAAFTSTEPVQGLDLRVTDDATELVVAPGDGGDLRRFAREGDSWKETFLDAGDDTAWLPRFMGDELLYHDRARADLCAIAL